MVGLLWARSWLGCFLGGFDFAVEQLTDQFGEIGVAGQGELTKELVFLRGGFYKDHFGLRLSLHG